MSRHDPGETTGTGVYPPPATPCGCGHIEGVHVLSDSGQRRACGATVAGHTAPIRCRCRRYEPGADR